MKFGTLLWRVRGKIFGYMATKIYPMTKVKFIQIPSGHASSVHGDADLCPRYHQATQSCWVLC